MRRGRAGSGEAWRRMGRRSSPGRLYRCACGVGYAPRSAPPVRHVTSASCQVGTAWRALIHAAPGEADRTEHPERSASPGGACVVGGERDGPS